MVQNIVVLLQVALTPLEVYNDVKGIAAPELDAEHLTEKAQGDAEACLRKLVVQLATQVNKHILLCPATSISI